MSKQMNEKLEKIERQMKIRRHMSAVGYGIVMQSKVNAASARRTK